MKPLSPRKEQALKLLILATGDKLTEALTMANKTEQRAAELLAALQENKDGLTFWKLCLAINTNIVSTGAALDKLIEAGLVEFVEPDLWRLKRKDK